MLYFTAKFKNKIVLKSKGDRMEMKSQIGILLFAAIVFAAIIIPGCGGGGGGATTPENSNVYAGRYAMDYSGSEDGKLYAVVHNDSTVSGTIHSSTKGAFSGIGTIDEEGKLGITAQTPEDTPVEYSWTGTLTTGGTANGTWHTNNGMTGSWNGNRRNKNAVDNQFAGNYQGTYKYDGEDQYAGDTWTALIGPDDSMYASVFEDDGLVGTGDGLISPTGSTSVSTTGHGSQEGATGTWEGKFQISTGQCTGSGTWSVDTGWLGIFTGTWMGQRT